MSSRISTRTFWATGMLLKLDVRPENVMCDNLHNDRRSWLECIHPGIGTAISRGFARVGSPERTRARLRSGRRRALLAVVVRRIGLHRLVGLTFGGVGEVRVRGGFLRPF